MEIDPKVKNLMRFLFARLAALIAVIYVFLKITGLTGFLEILGAFSFVILLYRIFVSVYRRRIVPAKDVLEYGKWAIVTGSTSGIGKEFADYLAKKGMHILLTSRSVDKLKAQKAELQEKYKVDVEYLAFDYTKACGPESREFYATLDAKCAEINGKGGLGVLINNVGISNEVPMTLDEFTDEEISDIIHCNTFSTVFMTRTVFKYMKERKNGAIVNLSSGSGNHPTPMLAVYSATKAFITQFSRSMHVECWYTGVDFLVVTPYYVVSNLYKRKSGTLIAPMPIELVKGTLSQLGKQYVWQGHGYWFHGLMGNIAAIYPGTTARYRKMMKDNRKRYDERQAAKKKAAEEGDAGSAASSKKDS